MKFILFCSYCRSMKINLDLIERKYEGNMKIPTEKEFKNDFRDSFGI